MEAALAGVRVIDASELLPGPYAALVLRDLGADVTKVERPPSGDSARTIAPGMFSVVNEGKDSIQIDLKSAEGAAAFAALVNEADILITGYRPGVARRLNVDYDTLRPRYPRLIYAALSGFGQSGALADVPGHDINFLSAAGVLSLTPDHPINTATGSGLPIGDLCGAMFAVTAILAALRQRERSGEGQFLDVSITACLRHWIAPRLGTMLHAGEDRWTPLPGYGPFTCGDGRRVALAAMEDHFWRDLVELLDCDAQGGGEDDQRAYRRRPESAARRPLARGHAALRSAGHRRRAGGARRQGRRDRARPARSCRRFGPLQLPGADEGLSGPRSGSGGVGREQAATARRRSRPRP